MRPQLYSRFEDRLPKVFCVAILMMSSLELISQDLVFLDSYKDESRLHYEKDYPECEPPRVLLRYIYEDFEIIRFKEEPKPGLFHYEFKYVYNSLGNEISSSCYKGPHLELSYHKIPKPDKILARRICNQFEEPFVYHSEWVEVPIVNVSRSENDTICNQFNGAEVEFNHLDTSYLITSTYENRYWITTTTRFIVNIVFCDEQDTILTIPSLPYTLDFGKAICLIEITMQHQTLGLGWIDCEGFTIYDNENYISGTLCSGDPFDWEIEDSPLISDLDEVESFFIAGFEVVIERRTGDLSGEGSIILPFQNKKILVTYGGGDLEINEDLQVVSMGSTSITVRSNGSLVIPTGSISLGGEICIDPEDPEWNENGTNVLTGEVWDPNGFGQNGQYIKEPPYEGYSEGDPYDPNYDPCGFDANGIHRETINLCNPSGCSRDSLTCEDPAQKCVLDCVPYYWLQEENVTEAGLIFYDSIKTDLHNQIDSLLSALSEFYSNDLDSQQDSCKQIADAMRIIVLAEELDSISIYGQDSKYILPGLSNHFIRAPERSLVRSDRNEQIVSLEDKHVQLYYCDKEAIRIQKLIDIIDSVQINDSLLLKFLEIEIKQFTQSKIDDIESNGEWIQILNDLINEYINDIESQGDFYGQIKVRKEKESRIKGGSEQFFGEPIGRLGLSSFPAIKKAFETSLEDLLVTVPDAELLPLKLTIPIDGEEVTIVITEIGIGLTYFTVDAYFIYNLPNGGEQLIFSCDNLQFTPNGFTGPSKLTLHSDVRIKLFNSAAMNIKADSTFVGWNCNGFYKMVVVGNIEFCPNIVRPVDADSNIVSSDPEESVRAYFQTVLTKLDGFYVELDITPFAVAGAENILFTVNNAVLDMSTIHSPGVSFPVGYVNENVDITPAGLPFPSPLWKGFYLEHLNVTFNSGGLIDENALEIDMYDAVIDDNGFSGIVSLSYELLSLEEGNIGGWGVSVDSLEIHFISNRLVGAGFHGLINIPLLTADCNADNNDELEEEDCFRYGVQFSTTGNYQFSVTPVAKMCAKAWDAKVILDNNSTVNLSEINGEFVIEAILNGSVQFGDSSATLLDSIISFQNVRLANKLPYFNPGTWQIPHFKVGLKGFEMEVFNLRLDSVPNESDQTRLSFVAGVEVNSTFKVKAQGGFAIYGNLILVGNKQRWVYQRTAFTGLYIKTEVKGTKLEGGLLFFDEATAPAYGKGFKASLDVNFAKMDFRARASGIFGKVDGYDYFNVDALFEFNPGIPVIGPLDINGIGGGLSFHMRKENDLLSLPADMSVDTNSASIFEMPLGESFTGIEYYPDYDSKIGIKIILTGTIKDPKICAYNAMFEIGFTGNGIESVSLQGNVRFMDIPIPTLLPSFDSLAIGGSVTDIKNAATPPGTAAISGYFRLKFNFQDNYLAGDFGLFLRAGSSQNPILYGEAKAEMHIGRDEWYFNLGRIKSNPDSRAKLTLDIAILKVNVAAYLNIGTGIPPMPPPPKQIQDLFGNISSPDASLGYGTGFAFGVAVDIDLDLDFVVGSIELNAGFGYDMSIKKYNNVECANTGGELGINGWYATGQAYLYVKGNVKLFGAELVSLNAGTLLQAGFPNPTWVRGYLGIKYTFIFFKGEAKAKFNFGEQCIPDQADTTGLPPVIANIYPNDQSINVDPLSSLVVDFNLPMDISFDYSEEEELIHYETKIDSVLLISGLGFDIPVMYELENDGMQMSVTPEFTLPPNDTLNFIIVVSVFRNGIEQTELNGLRKEITFTTDKGSNKIVEANILASYPLSGMANFYRDEYQKNEGYIILKRNQYELINLQAEESLVVVLSKGDDHFIGGALYNIQSRRIDFPLPKDFLTNSTLYKVEIGAVKSENLLSKTGLYNELSGEDYKKIEVLWNAVFRVSGYNSFYDKLVAIENELDLEEEYAYEGALVECLSLGIGIEEPFDEYEINTSSSSEIGYYLANKNDKLASISLSVSEMENSSSYSTEWSWIKEVLDHYYFPISDYLQSENPCLEFEYLSDLKRSVFIGSDCNSLIKLQPTIQSGMYDAMYGSQELAGFLDQENLDELQDISGNPITVIESALSQTQFLKIGTMAKLGDFIRKGSYTAKMLTNQAVQNCIIESGQGRSRSNIDPDCKAIDLVGQRLYDLAYGNEPSLSYPPEAVKIPIQARYTLPGLNLTTTIKNLQYTYQIY